jgi:tetratricopeptide (TPR) repeat protein
VEQFPENTRVWYEYGLYLEQSGNTEEAMLKMQHVLTIDPENPFALNYVGYTWADKGINLEEALVYLKRAAASRPEDGFIRDSLGWVYYKLGDYAKAVQELKTAVAKQPHDPTINEHLGDAYLKAGDLEKALVYYNSAVKLYNDKVKQELLRMKIKNTQKENQVEDAK